MARGGSDADEKVKRSVTRTLATFTLFLIFLKLFPVIAIAEVKELAIHEKAHSGAH